MINCNCNHIEGHILALPNNYTRSSSKAHRTQTRHSKNRMETTTCKIHENLISPAQSYDFREYAALDAKRLYPPIPLESTKAIHRFVGLPEDMDPIVDSMPMCNTGVLLNQQPLMILAGQTFDVRVDAAPGIKVPPAHLIRVSPEQFADVVVSMF